MPYGYTMGRDILHRNKQKISIYLPSELYEFLKILVKTHECASISHAVSMCIAREKERRKYT